MSKRSRSNTSGDSGDSSDPEIDAITPAATPTNTGVPTLDRSQATPVFTSTGSRAPSFNTLTIPLPDPDKTPPSHTSSSTTSKPPSYPPQPPPPTLKNSAKSSDPRARVSTTDTDTEVSFNKAGTRTAPYPRSGYSSIFYSNSPSPPYPLRSATFLVPGHDKEDAGSLRVIPGIFAKEVERRTRYPMDRGRSWAVLAAGFFTYFFQLGFVTGFGLFADVMATNFHATNTEATFAGGLAVGIMSVTAIIGTLVYKMLGSRLCIVFGGTWALLGFVSASFANSLAQMYSSIFAIGLGFGFNLISIGAVQVDYFDKYRLFALAFESVGSAVGTSVMPHILLALTRIYGWRGTLFLVGGGCSVFYLVAAIMASRRPRIYAAPLSSIVQVEILKRKTFLLCCLNCFLWGGASYSFFFFETIFLEFRGLGRDAAAKVVSILGVANVLARLASAAISQANCTNRVLFNAVACVIWSLSILFFTLPRGEAAETGLSVAAAGFGLGFGLMFPVVAPMLVELFGAEMIATSCGLAYFSLGVGTLTMPFLAGALADSPDAGYVPAYYLMGFTGLIAATILFGIAFVRKFRPPSVTEERCPSIKGEMHLSNSSMSVG